MSKKFEIDIGAVLEANNRHREDIGARAIDLAINHSTSEVPEGDGEARGITHHASQSVLGRELGKKVFGWQIEKVWEENGHVAAA